MTQKYGVFVRKKQKIRPSNINERIWYLTKTKIKFLYVLII
jgi:hypothetical protein